MRVAALAPQPEVGRGVHRYRGADLLRPADQQPARLTVEFGQARAVHAVARYRAELRHRHEPIPLPLFAHRRRSVVHLRLRCFGADDVARAAASIGQARIRPLRAWAVSLAGNTPASAAAPSPRCCASSPLATERRSVVGCRSRSSNSCAGAQARPVRHAPGRRPPRRPARTRPCRCRGRCPWCRSPARCGRTRSSPAPRSAARLAQRRPSAPPARRRAAAARRASRGTCAAWVSQPPISSAAMRGPSGAASISPAAAASAGNAYAVLSRRPLSPAMTASLKPRSRRPSAIAGPVSVSAWFSAAICGVEVRRRRGEAVRRPVADRRRAAQQQRHGHADRQRVALAAGCARRPAARRPRGSASRWSCGGRRRSPGSPAPRNGCARDRGRRRRAPAAASPAWYIACRSVSAGCSP